MEYKNVYLVTGNKGQLDGDPIAAFEVEKDAISFMRSHQDWVMTVMGFPLYRDGERPYLLKYYCDNAHVGSDGEVLDREATSGMAWDYCFPKLSRGGHQTNSFETPDGRILSVHAASKEEASSVLDKLIEEARGNVDNC